MQDNIHAAVVEGLENVLGEDRAMLAIKSSKLIADGYLDSFAFLELTAHIEDALNIIIPPAQLTPENYASVDTLAALCESLCSD